MSKAARAAVCTLVVIAIGSETATAQSPPNIILIVADDLGYGELGCYGQQLIKTPHLDRLAAEGVRFTQYYAGSPVCAPSRCTLMTGKHTGHAFIRNNHEMKENAIRNPQLGQEFVGQLPLTNAEVTVAELLHARGYATAAIGKWGLGLLGTEGDPRRQGFDSFYGYYCQVHAHNHYPRYLWDNDQLKMLPSNDDPLHGTTHSQDKFVEHAKSFIRANRTGPFLLYLPLIIPHVSIQPPANELAQYAGKVPEAPYEHGKLHYVKHPTPRAGYAAMVSYLDRGVGEIVDLVDELGLGENTLILFTSDNGATYERVGGSDSTFFHSTGGLRGRKGTAYEGGLRVPLLARWPGAIEPGESNAVCASWDILPTLCEAAGATPPADVDGISLLKLLTHQQPLPRRDYLYWEFTGYDGWQAIRWGDWKGVRKNIARGNSQWQVFNLADDPAEKHNLANDRPDIVAKIAALAAAAHVDSKEFPMVKTSELEAISASTAAAADQASTATPEK
jgi:arylsulfatase A